MDARQADPSGAKARKITFKNRRNLTEDGIVAFLVQSSDDEMFSDDDDDNIKLKDESDISTDMDDDDQDIIFPFVQQAQTQVPVATPKTNNTIPKWSDVPTTLENFPFSKTNRLLQPILSNEPIDYLRAIMDDEFIDLIVNETNYSAETLFLSDGITEKSRITRWKPVTSSEMLTFIGLVFHTGTIKVNRLQDYWKRHSLFNLTCFSQHMSRDRFLVIMRCLHFARNVPGQSEKDGLHEIKPVMNFFNKKMAALYYPGQQLSLEEPMVLCRGRLMFHQYIKNKKPKHDIKLYMLTEPDGTILKSSLHAGSLDDEFEGKYHITKIVLDLLANYLNSGHSVYLDNYYNSFELADKLTNHNTYCTGILNSGSAPKELLDKKLKNGETAAVYSGNVMIGKWKDKREFLYISNEHGNEMIEYVNKRNRMKQKPAPIFHYNKHMGDVDHQDQINAYYPCDINTLIWYKKLGIHFMQLMLLNSYFLYNKYSERKITLYNYRISIIEKLLGIQKNRIIQTYNTKKLLGVKNTRIAQTKNATAHVLTKITSSNKKGQTNRKRCRVCSKKNIRKMTLYHCEKCPDIPGFCVGECFKIFHAE